MNINIEGKTRNWIFFGVTALTIIVVLITYSYGRNQDKAFLSNYSEYQKAVSLINQKQYDQGFEILQNLDANSQATYQVQYLKGICAYQNGSYDMAAQFYQGAQETRPALLKNPEFLLNYGKILYELGNYERSEVYLQQIQNPNQEARQLLDSIAAMTGDQ